MNILSQIQSPADVKRLTPTQLETLATEIRTALVDKLSERGGHCAPNFGMVEATIALHYVFNSPTDKLVFDISHQSYVHKMLTGRAQAFFAPQHYADVSGYSEPSESEHDHFVIGHTSTSVSLACGLAKGRDLTSGNYNVVAIIGDGSLSGGEALEGLDWAAELGSNLIIVVNDNQMSIAENHGGLYDNLRQLRESNGQCPCNLFRAMGLDYLYVNEGNSIQPLIQAFQSVRDSNRPVVVHINTLKGKGYAPAEADKEAWHYHAPFVKETGEFKKAPSPDNYDDFSALTLLNIMDQDPQVCAITAGTPGIWGWTSERRQRAARQFVDVGIAEEHAVALASGMAKAGAKPVFGVCSSFIQRTYDQLSQDLCINDNPATILVLWGSLTAMNDVTHLCHFDIPLLSNIPNLVYLAPTNVEEYEAMLRWSVDYKEHPVAIRVPVGKLTHATNPNTVPSDYSDLNRFVQVEEGQDVAIIALGNFFRLGQEVANQLRDKGLNPTLINPRFISGIDEEMLNSLKANHSIVITLEDGALSGGFGEKIARFYATEPMRVLCYGGRKEFVDRFNVSQYLEENHLTAPQIVTDTLLQKARIAAEKRKAYCAEKASN